MRLVFDIETDGLLDTVTTLHCICATDIDTNREYSFYGATLKDGLELLENATALIGHNIVGYDLVAIKMLYPGFNPKGEILDTLVVSMILYPEIKEQDFMLRSIQQRDGKELFPGSQIGKHSLEAWGHRLGEYKDDFGRLPDGKLDPDRFKIFTWEMLEYCLQDVRVNVKMYERFATRLPNRQTLGLEHAVAKICIKQELFGWPFDVGNAEALWTLLTDQKNHIKERLQARFLGWVEETKTPEYYEIVFDGQSFRSSTKAGVVDEAYLSLKSQGMKVTKKLVTELAKAGPNKTIRRKFNPTSAIHVAKAFEEKYGWKPREFDKLGNPLINEDILTALEKKIPEAGMILEYQMLQDRCEKLKDGKSGWLKLQKNGRIHGRVIPNGTPTCRARHTTPNVAQVPAVKKPYGKECRQLFTCDPGYVLIGSDASGLELRVLSHYLFPFDGGRYARIVTEGRSEDGTDIHTLNAESVGITRDEAKTLIYCCVTMDTQALTKDGWKYYEDLSVGELILTYNQGNKTKEWKPVLEKVFYENAPVVDLRVGSFFNFKCTPNHRWFVRKRIDHGKSKAYEDQVRTTDTLTGDCQIYVNAPYDKEYSEYIPTKYNKYNTNWVGNVCHMSKNEVETFIKGFLLADGHYQTNGDHWSFSQNDNSISEAAITAFYLSSDKRITVTDIKNKGMKRAGEAKKSFISCNTMTRDYLPDQPVWCVRTENESWVARQGNTITITGNTIFGGSAKKVSESIGIPLKRAQVVHNDFKRGIVGYNQLLQAILTTLNTRGFLVGIDGRKLYCRKPFAALNLLIQSAGAIICKLHMVYVNEMATKEGLDFNQLGWIHDENQYQVKPEHVERFKEILKESIKKTENTLKFNCPLDVNIVVGKNWAETH